VALQTAFTELFGVAHPIALAPMGGSAGGALTVAVSNAGGLGLLGGGREDIGWLHGELEHVRRQAHGVWGVGFQAWSVSTETIARSLEYEPAAVMLSFGDPRPFAPMIRASSARLIIQVVDLDEAQRALDVGADVIVAQGTEAGGHGGNRATLPFVPAVVDLVSPTPVLAAGGIADGRGLAAALSLGAAGALIGTRFHTSAEAIVDPEIVKAILNASGDDTERSCVLDIARGAPWPSRYTARTLRNEFLDEWRDRDDELKADTSAQESYRHAEESSDLRAVAVWASEAIDLITETLPAGDIVRNMAADAEAALRQILSDH